MRRIFHMRLRFLAECAALLALHLLLLHLLATTHVMEKFMAAQFGGADFALITAFIISRFIAYFIVPAALVAFVITVLLRRSR